MPISSSTLVGLYCRIIAVDAMASNREALEIVKERAYGNDAFVGMHGWNQDQVADSLLA